MENTPARIAINTAVARVHGEYAGILYAYLTKQQAEYANSGDYAKRLGIYWVPRLSNEQIALEVPCFPDSKTVKRAAKKLQIAALILTETTGAFLEEHLLANNKKDVATWWHVTPRHKGLPAAYFDSRNVIHFDAEEAKQHGVPFALILAYYRAVTASAEHDGYKRLSPAEMSKFLPGEERAIARQLKGMVKRGLIYRHGTHKKHYRLFSELPKAEHQGRAKTAEEMEALKKRLFSAPLVDLEPSKRALMNFLNTKPE